MYFIPRTENRSSAFISYIQGVFIIRQYFIWRGKWTTTENAKNSKIAVIFQQKENNSRIWLSNKIKQ